MNRVEEKTVNIKKLSGGQRKSKRLRCNNLVDPWCQNRALYTQEAKRVEKKKTKTMGYGLFAKENLKKGETIIRMEEPVRVTRYFNHAQKNTIPWTIEDLKKPNPLKQTIRLNGNKEGYIHVNNTAYANKGRVNGTVFIKGSCANIYPLFYDENVVLKVKNGCIVPLPDDAAINSGEGNVVYYDNSFTDLLHIPLWYRINHSIHDTNAEVTSGNQVKWVALRDIKKGEQIFFNYGWVPDEWNE